MDVEKTIEFLLEQQAAQQARFEAGMDALSGKLAEMADQQLQTRKELAGIQQELRRAVRLGVEEARRERVRRRALDQKLDLRFGQLAAAQVATERSLQRLIDSLQQPRNGHD